MPTISPPVLAAPPADAGDDDDKKKKKKKKKKPAAAAAVSAAIWASRSASVALREVISVWRTDLEEDILERRMWKDLYGGQ